MKAFNLWNQRIDSFKIGVFGSVLNIDNNSFQFIFRKSDNNWGIWEQFAKQKAINNDSQDKSRAYYNGIF